MKPSQFFCKRPLQSVLSWLLACASLGRSRHLPVACIVLCLCLLPAQGKSPAVFASESLEEALGGHCDGLLLRQVIVPNVGKLLLIGPQISGETQTLGSVTPFPKYPSADGDTRVPGRVWAVGFGSGWWYLSYEVSRMGDTKKCLLQMLGSKQAGGNRKKDESEDERPMLVETSPFRRSVAADPSLEVGLWGSRPQKAEWVVCRFWSGMGDSLSGWLMQGAFLGPLSYFFFKYFFLLLLFNESEYL